MGKDFWERFLEKILGPHYQRNRFICKACVRDGDKKEYVGVSDLGLCGRCRTNNAEYHLRRQGFDCPICRQNHMDACSERAIKALLQGGA